MVQGLKPGLFILLEGFKPRPHDLHVLLRHRRAVFRRRGGQPQSRWQARRDPPSAKARTGGVRSATPDLAGHPTEEESMATASDVAELLATHPSTSAVHREALARCIAECFDCARSCTACADAGLAEDDVSEM